MSSTSEALVGLLHHSEWSPLPTDNCPDDTVVEVFGTFVPSRGHEAEGTVYYLAHHMDEELSLVSILRDGRQGAITKDQTLIRGLFEAVKEAAHGS